MARPHARIAVVEPDEQMLSLCLQALAQEGHHALGIPSVELALVVLPRLRVDVVVLVVPSEEGDRVSDAITRRGRGPVCVPRSELTAPPTRASLLGAVERAIALGRARGLPTEPEIDVQSYRAWSLAS